MDRPNVSNNKTQIRVEWMTPKAFKANITRYIIQYENEYIVFLFYYFLL